VRMLYVAWQDPERRTWYPVAQLTSEPGNYKFVYTKGAKQAIREAGFRPLATFPELDSIYVSEQLFPLFSNRLLPESRPEYKDYLGWLNVPNYERDPVAILGSSGGRRVTDTLEVFPRPEREDQNRYRVRFLLHGLSHMSHDAIRRVGSLKAGDPLLAMHDFQNPRDSQAVALRTAESFPGDMFLIGYCPRYLKGDFTKLLRTESQSLRVSVVRVNPPPAPVQFRLLCEAVMTWPRDFQPFSDPEYEPIVTTESVGAGRSSLPSS